MTIVVGYIPNEYGRAALEAGIAEAELRQRGLVVVNGTKGDALVDRRFASKDDLNSLRERLSSLPCDAEVRQGVGRDVAEEVIAVVEEVDATLLVIGIRHRSPVGKMFMGSVSQRLLLDSPCPVLSVKP